jgi:hypothetical protein
MKSLFPNMEQHEVLMLGIFFLAVLMLMRGLLNRSKSGASKINIDDLLIGVDGKISKAAAVMMGSFFVTSWVVMYQALNHSLTDVTFGAYIAAWVVPTVAAIIKGQPTPVSMSVSETTSTKTVEVPPP